MKKIVFLRMEDTPFGGAENYLRRLTAALHHHNVSFEIRYCTAPKWLASWIKALWFNFEARWKKKEDEIYFSLARIDSADIYRAGDGVHRCFLRAMDKKSLNPYHWVTLWLEKRTFKNAKIIIANSQKGKQEIIDTYRISENKIEVIHNGIDVEAVAENYHKPSCLETDKPIILFVGTGFHRKGLARCLYLLSNINVDYQFIVLGKDKNQASFEKLAQQLKINALFLGQRKDIAAFYYYADIVITLPCYEPFSNVILEAMKNHCAVITSEENGAGEILAQEFTAEKGRQETLRKLLTNQEFLQKTKNANAELIKQYSIEKNINQTLRCIEHLRLYSKKI